MKKINFILGVAWSDLFISNSAWSATATAVLKGTAPDSKITGNVTLTEEKGGLTVVAKVSNVPPGAMDFISMPLAIAGIWAKPQADILIRINHRTDYIPWMAL